MYMYMHTCISVCACVCACLCARRSVCVYLYIVYVYMSICRCVCINVFTCIYTYMHVYVYIRKLTHAHCYFSPIPIDRPPKYRILGHSGLLGLGCWRSCLDLLLTAGDSLLKREPLLAGQARIVDLGRGLRQGVHGWDLG